MQKRLFGARRCGDDKGFDINFLRGNGRAARKKTSWRRLPSSSLNVTKAAAHKERWREDIKCALLNEAG